MKSIIYFTKYSKLGASSRLRSIQFFPYLEKQGYKVHISHLFGDNYLKALYRNKRNKFIFLFLAYIKRFFSLYKVFTHDIVVIEKELFPYLPPYFEIFLNKIGIKYFADYDDAIFHHYDMSKNLIISKFYPNKIDLVMKNSFTVFAGNSYLAERAINSRARKVIIIPTVIDTDKYYKVPNVKNDEKFIIGWIGSPSTFKYIKNIIPIFKELNKKYPQIQVNIIGAKQNKFKEDFIHYIPWSENTEVQEINKFNVGLMPLYNTPWELGKCSYKLIQYMGCHVAVIASPVGMNNDVVRQDYNGRFVEENNWFKIIELYINNKHLCIEHGNNGRKLIESTYNIKHNLKLIIEEFEN